jgi:uncharacterized membrane protein YtjA (UPF0391 family)
MCPFRLLQAAWHLLAGSSFRLRLQSGSRAGSPLGSSSRSYRCASQDANTRGALDVLRTEVQEIRNVELVFEVPSSGLLAAVVGFTGIAPAAAGIAKILFFLFLVLFLASLIAHVAQMV